MENDKLNWPMCSTEEMISWAGDHVGDYAENTRDCAGTHAELAKLEFMEAICQALVEIRNELRRLNDGKVE
jgi:hypothetical protein